MEKKMKKKIICGIFFLTILFCISYSQTHFAAVDTAGLFSRNPPGTEPSPEQIANTDFSPGGAPGPNSSSENISGTDPSPGDAPGAASSLENISGGDSSLGDAPGIDSSVENASGFPDGRGTIPDIQSVIDAGGQRVPMGDLATPEPLENTASSTGEFTLSLTTSIGTLTYYNQSDSRWADYPYGGSDPLAVYGCGPTVMAMLVTSFTENTVQPPDMAAWSAANHYWSSGYGTRHEFIPEGAAAFGLHAESFRNLTAEGVMSELKSGHILVALMGPGHFSDSGHFIIITEDWSGNQVRVADPARLERTQAAWDVQLILDELLTNATAGGPVWSITPK